MHAEWRVSTPSVQRSRGRRVTIGPCPIDPPPWTRRGARSGRRRRPSGRTVARAPDVPRPLDGARRDRRPADPHGPGAAARLRARSAARWAVLPELFADLDAVFISHGHHDHLDPRVAAPHPRQADGHRPARVRRHGRRLGAGPGRGGGAGRPADDRPRRARGRPRRALRQARAVRARRARDRVRRPRLADRSTSPATRTCSRPWTSWPARWTRRSCRCGAGDRRSAGAHGSGAGRRGGGAPAAAGRDPDPWGTFYPAGCDG